MLTFPPVSGSNLEGRRYALPRDFEGDLTLIMIAFQQWQQRQVNGWLPGGKALARQYGIRYYELPTLPRWDPLRQWLLNSGMRAGIPDKHTREMTITLYTDLERFCRALDIPDLNDAQVMLLDRAGGVLWRTRGDVSPDKLAGLTTAVSAAQQR
jgi:hypothetical protein